MIALLGSKDYSKLHKNLEALHRSLVTYEPSIIARKRSGDLDDPYELLDIEYDASPERINEAYKKLKAAKSPEALEKQLKKQGIGEKDRKKRLKEARLSWSFIQDAYETLKNPNERALVRKELKNKIAQESRHEQSSKVAFNALFDALTTAFYPHAILKEIRGLLEQYKPQELEKATKQIELEKKVAERAKQVTRVETTPRRPAAEKSPYDEFYQKMAYEPKPVYPSQPHTPVTQPEKGGGKESKEGNLLNDEKIKGKGPDKGGKKEEGKKDEGKKDDKGGKQPGKDGGKDGQKDGKESKEGKFDKKDVEKYAAFNAVKELLSDAAKKKEAIPGAGEGEQIVLEDILANFETNIKGTGTDDTGIRQLKQFADAMHFEPLFEALKKIAPDAKNPKLSGDKGTHDDLCAEWEKSIWKPYSYLIKRWHDGIYGHLGKLRVTKRYGTWNQAKAKAVSLNTPEATHEDLLNKKWKKPEAKGNAVNLAAVRDLVRGIEFYFSKISDSCEKLRGKRPDTGPVIPRAKPKPVAPRPTAPEPVSDEDDDDDSESDAASTDAAQARNDRTGSPRAGAIPRLGAQGA